jgi:hypothetical protein
VGAQAVAPTAPSSAGFRYGFGFGGSARRHRESRERFLADSGDPREALHMRSIASFIVIGCLALPARAGEASASESNTSGEGGSSEASGGSSDSSEGTSQGSAESSENSKGSSNQESTEETTTESSRETTRSEGGQALSIGTAVLIVGVAVVGAVFAIGSSIGDDEAAAALGDYLRRHHAMVTRDVLLARGPSLDAWCSEIGLARDERERLLQALDGSPEQAALLASLTGDLGADHARAFAAAFVTIAGRVLGEERIAELTARARRGRAA